MPLNVGIFIYDEVEVLDFAGPFEVFNVACRVRATQEPGAKPPFNVFTVGQTANPIKARGALKVTPQFTFQNHPPIDLIIIPGGVVTAELAKNPVIRWVTNAARASKFIASVCTGAFLLAKAGVLTNQRATTHWQDIDDLRKMFPGLQVEEHVRWVEEGNLITSAGISAGIDMSLHLVEKLEGEKLALDTARQMDYRWMRNP